MGSRWQQHCSHVLCAGVPSYPFLRFQVPLWGCLVMTPQSTFDAVTQMSSVRPRMWYAMHVSPTLEQILWGTSSLPTPSL